MTRNVILLGAAALFVAACEMGASANIDAEAQGEPIERNIAEPTDGFNNETGTE